MTKERALTRLRGLWFKYQVNHLAVLEGVDMMGLTLPVLIGLQYFFVRLY